MTKKMLFSQKEAKKVKKASFYKPPILSAFEHNLKVGVILQGLDFLYNKEKKIHLTYYQSPYKYVYSKKQN